MEFLKKRRGAAAVFAAVILLGTLFGLNRSLGKEMQRVSDLFYDGANNAQGFKQKSIRSQLIIRCEASANLLSVAPDNDKTSHTAASLRNACNNLLNLMETKAGPSELYKADRELEASFRDLYNALTALELDEKELKNADDDLARFNGAGAVISSSDYNEAVRDFNRSVLAVFPTNLLRSFCFAPEPEFFE